MKFSIPRFTIQVFAASMGLLAVFVAGAWYNTHAEHVLLSDQIASSVRNDLLMGDLRTAMVTLKPSLNRDFSSIGFVDHDGIPQIQLGEPGGGVQIQSPVRLTHSSDSSARLIFEYQHWRAISKAFYIWLAIVVFNLPFIWWISRRLKLHYKKTSRDQSLAKIGELTRQVAHDIRSPITALKALSPHLEFRSDGESKMFANTLARLEAIAEDVLVKGSREDAPARLGGEEIRELVTQVASEREAAWNSRRPLSVALIMSGAVPVVAERHGLARLLSNVLQNSWEAEAKHIKITAQENGGGYSIELRDDGHGIPPEILAKIGQEGFSFGKSGGNGLGIYSAKQTVKSWGGDLQLSSAPGFGTRVLIRLKGQNVTQTS